MKNPLEKPTIHLRSEKNAGRNTAAIRSMLPHIQPKLKIGSPNDKYEQEADRMADLVTSAPTPAFANTSGDTYGIQRKCAACEKEELQKKPLSELITPLAQRQSIEEEDDLEGQITSDIGVQRMSLDDDEDININRKGDGETLANPSLESQLSSSKGGGNPLPETTRQSMEPGFGADFSKVRIHTDSQAIQMSQDLNAQAFTHGSDVYFNQGKFSPDSSQGKHLLAHELTHVVQQRGNQSLSKSKIQKQDADWRGFDGYTRHKVLFKHRWVDWYFKDFLAGTVIQDIIVKEFGDWKRIRVYHPIQNGVGNNRSIIYERYMWTNDGWTLGSTRIFRNDEGQPRQWKFEPIRDSDGNNLRYIRATGDTGRHGVPPQSEPFIYIGYYTNPPRGSRLGRLRRIEVYGLDSSRWMGSIRVNATGTGTFNATARIPAGHAGLSWRQILNENFGPGTRRGFHEIVTETGGIWGPLTAPLRIP